MSMTDYDYISLFTPEGKVKPLENIHKSVELGSTAIGIATDKVGAIVVHNLRTPLSYTNKKVFNISPSSLFTFSGITNDGHLIVNYLLNKSINERVNKDREIDPVAVFDDLSYHAGLRTMYNQTRPFGCGGLLLTSNSNKCGVRLVEFGPSGSVLECHANAIGTRAQSARTVLERDWNADMGFEEVVKLGIRALKNAVSEVGKESVEIWAVDVEKGAFEVEAGKYFDE